MKIILTYQEVIRIVQCHFNSVMPDGIHVSTVEILNTTEARNTIIARMAQGLKLDTSNVNQKILNLPSLKIPAIQVLRKISSMGLVDTKRAIEDWDRWIEHYQPPL